MSLNKKISYGQSSRFKFINSHKEVLKMNANTKNIAGARLPLSTKLGYGVGQAADSAGYNLYYTYFLFFLTDVAGISPAFAGVVSLIAVSWDAITDPIIGYFSDNCKSKYGRRRPFMIGSALPYALIIFLLFVSVNFSPGVKNAYYVIMAVLLWTSYTGYVIPYFSIGAEITQDFNERNTLRSYATIFMGIAVLLASAAPVLIADYVVKRGGTMQTGWTAVGAFFAIFIFIAIVLCWRFTRGREIEIDWSIEKPKQRIIKTYISTLKIKTYRYLLIAIFVYLIGFSIALGQLVYLMTYNLGLDVGLQSLFWTLYAGLLIPFTPLINYLANKFGKRLIFILSMGLMSAVMFVFGIIGFSGFSSLIVFVIFFSFGNTVFWTLIYSMIYDMTEIDEFLSGKRREGAIIAFASFFQKLGAAVALWLAGTILDFSGYVANAEVQVESALKAIHYNCTLLAGVCTAICMLMIIIYPMNAKRFEALKEALALKNQGKEYSTDGFKELL